MGCWRCMSAYKVESWQVWDNSLHGAFHGSLRSIAAQIDRAIFPSNGCHCKTIRSIFCISCKSRPKVQICWDSLETKHKHFSRERICFVVDFFRHMNTIISSARISRPMGRSECLVEWKKRKKNEEERIPRTVSSSTNSYKFHLH